MITLPAHAHNPEERSVKRPTMADIARRAGVTKSAVSFALNGRPGKEALQKQALAEVRGVLKAQKAPEKVEGLYFTSLVIQ